MPPGKPAAILLVPDGEEYRHDKDAERLSANAVQSDIFPEKQMSQTQDPTFYRTPADAIAAPQERLAYVAALDPAGQVKDAIAVLDTDSSSPDYGKVVGWSELPTAGNELHHFGWNACSSALCHEGHHGSLERRYLVVPGIRSSRTYILDTKPDPRQPQVVRTIEPEERSEERRVGK